MPAAPRYPTQSHGQRLKHSIREWLCDRVYSHWTTLNFHAHYDLDRAQHRLQRFNMNMNSRLFRSSRFDGIATTDLHFFFAVPEHTKTGNIHWHMFVQLVPEASAKYLELAPKMWKRIVPTGSSDIQLIKDTVADHLATHVYGTKCFARAESNENFVTSNMLNDGRRTLRPHGHMEATR